MRALLVIDMLKDFLEEGRPLYVPQGRKIIPRIRERIREAKKEGVPVIFICDSHLPGDMEMKIWPSHALRGSGGAEVVEELRPEKGDYVIFKRRYSGFLGTDLDILLRELGVEEVILTGVLTHICILFTAADAFMRGYRVVIPRDSVASISEEYHEFALKLAKEVLQAEIV